MRIFFKNTAACLLAGILFLGAGLSSAHAQNKFWGMTSAGGDYNQGAIFSMNDDGTGTTIQYSFKYDGSGAVPYGSLIQSNGIFYGVTQSGGANGAGVIFSFDQLTNTYTKLYEFDGLSAGTPYGGLTAGYQDGKLYGATLYGGIYGEGVIYSFDPASGSFSELFDMYDGSTGSYPLGPLVLYNNKFYGTTYFGGVNNSGTLFSFDPATNACMTLRDFSGGASSQLLAGSLVVSNNVLYGVNANGNGELFSYKDDGSGYTSLFTFGSSGTQTLPMAITSNNGKIYGTTYNGGTDNWGGIFSFDPATGTYSEPAGFPASSSGGSFGSLTPYNGKLYGMGYSSIFQVDLTDNSYTDLQDMYLVNLSTPQYTALLLAGPPIVGTTPQTITFSDLQKTYGDADFAGGATASSGLKITYKSSDPTIAAITGGKIHIVAAGTCTITASQIGDPTYAAATDVPVTLTVSKADLLITAVDTVKNQLQPNPVFRLSYTGFVNGETASNLLSPPMVITTATDNSPQGVYPITASGATSNNYAITYQGGTLTVIGQYQTLSFSDMVKVYGDPDFDPGATASSGLPVTYVSSNPAVAVVTANGGIKVVGVGTDTIKAIQAGDAIWAPAFLNKILMVNKAGLTIVVDSKTKVYRQSDPPFTATFTGLVNGDDLSNIGAVFSSSDSGADASPGEYLINVTLGPAASNNYSITSYQSGVLVISPLTGAGQNNMDAYFSSNTSLQVNVWMTAGQKATIQIYDLAGRLLINKETDLAREYNTLTLPAAGLATGIYIVRVIGDKLKLTQTIRKIN